MNDYSPIMRSGKECTKRKCVRYLNYIKWYPGDSALNFCMECKNSHVSQFKSSGSIFTNSKDI
jgi:hypothetical protein